MALRHLPRCAQFAVGLLRFRRVHASGRDPVRAGGGVCRSADEDFAERRIVIKFNEEVDEPLPHFFVNS